MKTSNFPESGHFFVGLNYWASHAATEMWSRWSEKTVRRDFTLMRRYGVEVVRCFPLWPDFQPIKLLRMADGTPVDVRMGEKPLPRTFAGQCGMDETMLAHFRELCDIAQENDIKLIVPLLTGHMTSRLFVPPALEGMNLLSNPLALKYEVKFIRGFVGALKDHPAILAWESGNEPNCFSGASESAAAWSWTALIHGTIRAADPTRPVIGIDAKGLEDTPRNRCPWLICDQAELSDVLSAHPYSLWDPALNRESFRSFRNLHHAALEIRLLSDIGGRPAFIEETGTWRPMTASGPELAGALRTILWNLYQENGRGLLWWCAFDQTRMDMAPYDWPTMGLEHGIFRENGDPHPIAEELRHFREFIDSLPFAQLPEQEYDAVCIVNTLERAFGAYLLARRAKLHLHFRLPSQELEDAPVYLLPSAERRAGLSTGAWHELLKKADAGATLYLSLNDTILDGLPEAVGCRVLARDETNDTVTLRIGERRFTLPRPVRYRMEACGAEVLGTSAEGDPLFFRFRYGKGTVYTLALPLEEILIGHTGLTDGGFEAIYQTVLPVKRLMTCDDPCLTVTEHRFSECEAAVILVNNRTEAIEVKTTCDWEVTARYSDCPEAAYENGTASLPANSGILLVLHRKRG